MAALKKFSIALALILAVSFLGVDAAQAQSLPQRLGSINCTAFSVPTLVRAEGLAELFGDFRLECTNTGQNGSPGLAFEDYVRTNIALELLNTNVTTAVNVGSTGFTEVSLILNENNAFDPRNVSVLGPGLPAGAPVTSADCGAPDPRFPCPQKGRLVGTNTLVWDDVLFPVPGAPEDPNAPTADCGDAGAGQQGLGFGTCFPAITRLRIVNVRGNATVFGLGNSLPDLTARVTITGPQSISVDDAVKTLATPRIGLITTISTTASGLQCIGLFDEEAVINLQEGFAASFKTLGTPSFEGGGRISENGYPILVSNSAVAAPQTNGGTGGGATQATQFRVTFLDIPDGVTLEVPRHINNAGGEPGACADGANVDGDALCISLLPYSTSTGLEEVTLIAGNGFVEYVVVDGNPFALEDIDIVVTINAPPDTADDLPEIGTGTANATFSPLSTVGVASNNPRPRFIDPEEDPDAIVTIFRCTTTLLFPFVTNDSGFDTGIAISNTSDDWIGTDPQRGACTIHYIGLKLGGPNDKDEETSDILEGGEQLVFTVSGFGSDPLVTGNPGFQGFIIAECQFQFAHGFAFITDGFGGPSVQVAQGYLALVIPRGFEGERVAGVWHCDNNDGTDCAADQFGERLGQ
jgi:hypothetical protein